MVNDEGSKILDDIYIYKRYYPKDRRIDYYDGLCLDIIRRILKDKPHTTVEHLKKTILQILKEEHYQLVYHDGHIPEYTRYLYEIITNTIDIDPSTSKFELFLCNLIYWSKEYYHIIKSDDKKEVSLD